jgi:ABC-type transport system involved in cytochrome c biogenesis permease subunit
MWLLVLTLVLHTFALVARIYISGRPPITNLYSTAIFIGWGGVILAMMLEMIYRLGLGNIVAAVIGFLTLLVAHFLSLDGDTFIVLQAVLDTQFWLATHVVTINLGYAATYTAGLWGAIYVLFAHVFPVLTEDSRHKLQRMLYGTLCFAIYLSFVGTVLGGLWGDDSWGRFWGWDPKENGALMIVIWNALVLHARWGGLVKGRGLATLAVAGNIVTTWSYFGVNELGEGLHAYVAVDVRGVAICADCSRNDAEAMVRSAVPAKITGNGLATVGWAVPPTQPINPFLTNRWVFASQQTHPTNSLRLPGYSASRDVWSCTITQTSINLAHDKREIPRHGFTRPVELPLAEH